MAKVVHFEIPVDDAERAMAFYRGAFGWDVTDSGAGEYWLVNAGSDDEPGANGALTARSAVHKSPVVIVGVDDLDGVLGRIEGIGARVVQGKLAIPGIGWSAYVLDTEGNTIGLFQPSAPGAAGQ
ncbi:MAG TPA: VOC family protein [Acidimicrobiales bacterium]|nr:VOC family protein [Acidimicrobiales bacterium]